MIKSIPLPKRSMLFYCALIAVGLAGQMLLLCLAAIGSSRWQGVGLFNIVCSIALLAMIWTFMVLAFLTVSSWLRDALPSHSSYSFVKGWRWIVLSGIRLLLVIAGVALAAIYVMSWLFYARTGHFIDFEALCFGIRNHDMIRNYLWQSQPLYAGVFVVLLVCVGCGLWRLVRPRAEEPVGNEESEPIQHLGFRSDWSSLALTAWLLVTLIVVARETAIERSNSEILRAFKKTDNESKFFSMAANHIDPMFTMLVGAFDGVSNREQEPIRLSSDVLGEARNKESIQRRETNSIALDRPVIVIAVESLREDVIGQKVDGKVVMPFTSRLAETGVEFRRAYAQSTHSNYADPCVFSSLYPLRTKKHHYYSADDPWPKTLLYDVLHEYGYRTAMFSSQNEGWGNMDSFLKTRSLDLFFDSRSFDGQTYVAELDSGFAQYAKEAKVAGKLDDAVTIEQAIQWVDQCDAAKQTYCVCLNLQSSHFPYPVPDKVDTPFQPCEIDFEASFLYYPPEKVEVVRNAYFNALRYIDTQIERLVESTAGHSNLPAPIVVVLGDNGESFYEHGFPTHGGPPVEPQVNVAMVFSCPGFLEPAKNDYLTQMIDVVPTVLGLLEIPPPRCAQGIDVLANGRLPNEERLVFFHCNNGRAKADAVLSSYGWKCTFDNREKTVALNNIMADTSETQDFSVDYPDVRSVLQDKLESWRKRQLGYYATPAYYGFWYPPRTPVLTESEATILKDASNRLLYKCADSTGGAEQN